MNRNWHVFEREQVWTIVRAFAHAQYHRALFRLHILRWLALSLGFWTALLAAYIVLDRAGLGWVGSLCIAAWLAVTIPQAVLQLRLISDVAGYAFTGRLRFFPAFQQALTREPGARPPLWAQVWAAAGITFPLSGLALWCYGVLLRLPYPTLATEPATAAQRRSYPHAGRPVRGAQRAYWHRLSTRLAGAVATL